MNTHQLRKASLKALVFIVASGFAFNAISACSRSNTPDNKFTDIEQFPSKGYINGLAEKGYIGGFPDGNFHPNENLTRAQFAVLISKAFSPRSKSETIQFKDSENFPD